MNSTKQSLAVAIALALAATTMPTVWAQSGGGAVTNTLPTVESSSAEASPVNEGTATFLEGTVMDRNKETDIQSLQMELLAAPITLTSSERPVTSTDTSQGTEPTDFDAGGWKVWNSGGAGDGVLSFKFEYTYNTAGTYVWRVSVKDEGAYQSDPVKDVTVEVNEVINVYTNMVDDTGADDGALWGGWAADPGATASVVPLTSNFVKVENTGTSENQAFTVSFSTNELASVGASEDTISLDDGVTNNIKFACVEKTSDVGPGVVDFSAIALPAADGVAGVECAFSATGNFMYVAYEIQDLPSPLADDDYRGSFTVTGT